MDTMNALRAREEEKHNPAAALAVICVGYFMVILDATVTNVALPSIGRGLHGSVTGRSLTPRRRPENEQCHRGERDSGGDVGDCDDNEPAGSHGPQGRERALWQVIVVSAFRTEPGSRSAMEEPTLLRQISGELVQIGPCPGRPRCAGPVKELVKCQAARRVGVAKNLRGTLPVAVGGAHAGFAAHRGPHQRGQGPPPRVCETISSS
jgi:hypothetical protein